MSTDSLPDDIETLKRLVQAREAELAQARAEAANARAEVSSAEALIAHQQLIIAKFKRSLFGPRNERKARLIDQMELELEEMEAAASEDELAAEKAAAPTPVRSFSRRKPARKPFRSGAAFGRRYHSRSQDAFLPTSAKLRGAAPRARKRAEPR